MEENEPERVRIYTYFSWIIDQKRVSSDVMTEEYDHNYRWKNGKRFVVMSPLPYSQMSLIDESQSIFPDFQLFPLNWYKEFGH